MEATKLIAKSQRWQQTAIAAAAIALLGLTSSGAFALSLGRITVQSALGEPLRAEIEVPDINAEEAASLSAKVAAPSAFVAAGLDYNPAMSGLQATLQRRADGRAFLRLSSDRSINDPFVDMILEATWSSGRIVRDYTMLFDPPTLRQAAPAATLPQVVAAPAVPAQAVPAPLATVANEAQRTAAAKPTAPVATARPKPVMAAESSAGQQVVVKNGDTASKIAARAAVGGVSLDQMLVAMIRSNPDAFANNNLNRLRSGAVLNMPTAEQAASLPAKEASQMVVAQSKDFNEFRRNLAGSAPKADVAPADRKASGNVEAKVEDKKPSAATPDKLTLSKGSVQAKADEAKIAKERADKEAATRAAEIAKNIGDLAKLSAASAPKSPAAPMAAPAASTLAVAPTPALPVAAAPPAAASSPVPVEVASAPAPAAVVSAPTTPKATVPAPMPVEPPGLLDELLGDPLVPAAAGGLIALLAGFGFYRMRQNKKNATRVDSSFLESRLQPDSFFGASGGQRVDTANEAPGNPSSMVYSTSQLDAADDVDPVAEADVYLAYGRDLQAEEILKEAVRHNPGRLAIHTKLLEIFAKRRDAVSFQATAQQAFKLTGPDSPDWARICDMGIGIDPDNALYQPGGASPSAFINSLDAAQPAGNSTFRATIAQSSNAELTATPAGGVDLDLDLDFSIDDEPASAINDVTGTTVSAPEKTQKLDIAGTNGHGVLDFDISGPAELDASPGMRDLDLDTGPASLEFTRTEEFKLPTFDVTKTMPVEVVAPADAVASNSGMLEFDMGSLSLDLDSPSVKESGSESSSTTGEDPLETKLALAEEFVSIGDEDGARALIEEVVAEATGDMRAKAQRALVNLG